MHTEGQSGGQGSPPMGWNTWDCYGSLITEAEVRANADCLAQRLLPYGWDHVVIDINWYQPSRGLGEGLTDGGVRDRFGRYQPAPNRFPSAADGAGFRPLADFIHSRGLKFGIHIMRGVPRRAVELREPVKGTAFTTDQVADLGSVCGWNSNDYGINMNCPGGQAYYDSLLELYAAWEVDFVKADDMTRQEEIDALVCAVDKCGRPMTLSIVGINAPTPLSHPRARMYRISQDVWDQWRDPETPWCDVNDMLELAASYAPKIVEGCYPDADMLPIGRIGRNDAIGKERPTRLTPAEQTTLLTLWSIFRSPLMLGGSVVDLDDSTYSLLTNPEVLAVNQRSRGNRPLHTEAERGRLGCPGCRRRCDLPGVVQPGREAAAGGSGPERDRPVRPCFRTRHVAVTCDRRFRRQDRLGSSSSWRHATTAGSQRVTCSRESTQEPVTVLTRPKV